MRRRGLAPARPVVAGLVIVAAVAAVLAFLLTTVIDLRDSSRDAEHSERILASATVVEKSVIDLETGARGYVITGRPTFLSPWTDARRSLPEQLALLARLVGSSPQASQVRMIDQSIQSYLSRYSIPLVGLVRTNPRLARSLVATAIGKRLLDGIRNEFTSFEAAEERLAATRRDRANASADRAVIAGIGGLVLLVLLVALFTTYIARAFSREVRATDRTSNLQAVTAALSRASSSEEVARAVAEQAIATFVASEAAVAVWDGGELSRLARVAGELGEAGGHAREGGDDPTDAAERVFDAARRGGPGSVTVRLESTNEDGWVGVPLIGSIGPLGVLAVGFAAPRQFDRETRALMVAIGAQGGQALERAELAGARVAALADAQTARERLAFLARASALLAESLDYEATLRRVADLAVAEIADWCSIDLTTDDGQLRNVAVAHRDPGKVRTAKDLQERYPPDPNSPSGPAAVIRSGRSLLYSEIPDAMIEADARSEEELRFVRELGLRSAMIVPLAARGRTLGALTLIATEERGRNFDDSDLSLAEDLARRAALAIDTARLYGQERGIAEALQHSLLPEGLPTIPNLALAAGYVPAESALEVGGDWYDVISLREGQVALVIGDVVGHGIPAAAVMGQLRSAVRAYALEGHSPSGVVDRVNAMLAGSGSLGMAGTMLLLVYDPAGPTVHYASAGHLPPLVVSPDGTHQFLEGGRSTPLGVRQATAPVEGSAPFERGSTLLLYTDGLVERRGEPLEDGLSRLRELVADSPHDAEALCDQILARVRAEGPAADDMALVVMHSVPLRTEHLKLSLPADPSAVGAARRAVREWLEEGGADTAEAFELSVAVGDACANAVNHAYGIKRGNVELDATSDASDVVIEVRDSGRWRSARGHNRGHGLELIRAFTDSLDIDRSDDGTRVQMRRRLADRPGVDGTQAGGGSGGTIAPSEQGTLRAPAKGDQA